ncbi:MAG: RNA polymerase sigma-70 factor [Adhaeribacter sp.]
MIQEDSCAAFDQIYARYWSKLYLSAYKMLGDSQAAEDIVQEVLVSLWMRRRHLAIESLPAFLYAAVRYQVFKVMREGKVAATLFTETGKVSVVNEGEGALMEKDIDHLLNQGIAKLPGKCRQIFLLSRKEHLSTQEIARWLGIAPKTVENQITIALHRLRATLGDFLFLACILFAGA